MQRISLLLLMVFMMIAGFVAFIAFTDKPVTNPFKKPKAEVGEAAIGGPFTLINPEGKTVKDEDFRGKYMLVYFGFTSCPDICPADLLNISSVLKALGSDADKLSAIFITVDPERDTEEQLKTYMENFDPRIIALTGSEEAIAEAAKSYRVFYQKVGEVEGMGYMMDHTAITYLMDKEGHYLTHFTNGTASGEITAKIRPYLQ